MALLNVQTSLRKGSNVEPTSEKGSEALQIDSGQLEEAYERGLLEGRQRAFSEAQRTAEAEYSNGLSQLEKDQLELDQIRKGLRELFSENTRYVSELKENMSTIIDAAVIALGEKVLIDLSSQPRYITELVQKVERQFLPTTLTITVGPDLVESISELVAEEKGYQIRVGKKGELPTINWSNRAGTFEYNLDALKRSLDAAMQQLLDH